MRKSPKHTGFTLIELLVTIAVLVILVLMAAPSFSDFSQRQAIKGVAQNIISVVAQAKEEAAKRDVPVAVEFRALGSGVCAGASVGTAGCDCSSSTCTLVSSAETVKDLKNVTMVGSPAFGSSGTGASFVIDPKTGTLLDFEDAGSVTLKTSLDYVVKVSVNPMARVDVCVPTNQKVLPGVKPCT